MADAKSLAILRQGASEWRSWRNYTTHRRLDLQDADLTGLDLSGLDLHVLDLRGANLSHANLSGADLNTACLNGANLMLADLSHANFMDASLVGANLSGACLSFAKCDVTCLKGANLTHANLHHAQFRHALLDGANLSRADLYATFFAATNLGRAINLEQCRHSGPCYLDSMTLLNTPHLPEAFLRGCGVPENLIEYLPSLSAQAIEYYSCFISYSTKDQDFAERLFADLQVKGVRCWYAPHHVQGGKKLHEQIDEAIRLHEKLLLVLSEASMDSEWVKTEIAKARMREIRENRRMLFPVTLVEFSRLRDWACFDADTGKDSAREIREYYVPDFSNWRDPDSYQKGFARLLNDLKSA